MNDRRRIDWFEGMRIRIITTEYGELDSYCSVGDTGTIYKISPKRLNDFYKEYKEDEDSLDYLCIDVVINDSKIMVTPLEIAPMSNERESDISLPKLI